MKTIPVVGSRVRWQMSGIYETDFVFFVVGVSMLKFQFIILFCHEMLIIDNGNENVELG